MTTAGAHAARVVFVRPTELTTIGIRQRNTDAATPDIGITCMGRTNRPAVRRSSKVLSHCMTTTAPHADFSLNIRSSFRSSFRSGSIPSSG